MKNTERPWWAKQIRDIRHKQGRTLEDVGGQAGVSKHYLSCLENGHHVPKIDMFKNIAIALGGEVSIQFPQNPSLKQGHSSDSS